MKRRLFFLLLVFSISISCMAGLKFTCTDENGLIYQCDEDDLTAILIGTNDKNIENVEIPQGVAPEGGDYWKIIAIGAKAFQGTKIKTVSMPYIVTIYHDAFQNCSNLTTVSNTQNLTTIDYNAFASCINLNSFEFSNCITSIGSSAFENTGFSEIELSGDITIDFNAFANCKSLTAVKLYNNLSLGERVFEACENLKTAVVDIPEIPKYLFENCNKLSSVELGDNVNSIGGFAFHNSLIGELVIPNSVTSLGQYAFAGMEILTSITLSNNIFLIPKLCFMSCKSLKTITIPDSVTEIEDEAFSMCRELNTVTLGSNVDYIGETIFSLSTNIKKIISLNPIPPTVRYSTFSNYKVTLEVPISSLDAYKSHTIWGKFMTINGIIDPDSPVTVHNDEAGYLSEIIPESKKYSIKKLIITGDLNSSDFCYLREMAGKKRMSKRSDNFGDTEGILESLDISKVKIVDGGEGLIVDDPETDMIYYQVTRLNEIPPKIFEGCKNLTEIVISDDVYSIGNNAFHGTTWYENQPDGLVYIGNMLYAYKGDMPANTNVTIKDGTIGIACSAFRYCTNLESVKIPSSVINIGGFNKSISMAYGYDGPFWGCTGLKSVISEIQNPPVFDQSTFGSYSEDIYSNAYLFVPTGTVDLYKSTEGWNNFTNIVDSDPTGINNILYNEGKDTPAYDLNGRRLYQPQKGIKIQNGKKVVVK